MGLFDKVFKSEREIVKEEIVEVPWHPLDKLQQLDEIEAESEERNVAIFKHSTRCGISRMVLKKFQQNYKNVDAPETKLYFLDLLSHRDISAEIAERFHVQHESPQLIILNDRKVVYHTSHHSIEAESLEKY